MAIIRNLSQRMISFDCAALGSQDHHGGTNPLDPQSGLRTHVPHVKSLPSTLTLTAASRTSIALEQAIADGSAVSGLPDEVVDDGEVKRLVASGVISAKREPAQKPATPAPDPHSDDEVIL